VECVFVFVDKQVLALVRGALLDDPRPIDDEDEERRNPMGLLHVTAMRLADIFSDDSNFRNLVMDQIVCLFSPHGLCSGYLTLKPLMWTTDGQRPKPSLF
jgi:hypothetical protein